MSEQHHHPKLSESTAGMATVRSGQRARLLWVVALTGVTMVAEFAGGILTGSLALLGDAFHMLTHFLAISLSYAAVVIAERPAPPDKTYRYWRIEILASLVNGIALVPIAGYVLYLAWLRWHDPVPILVAPMLGVAAIGLAVNVLSALFLHRHSRHDLNVRGAFLHMLSDSVSSVGVLAAGGVVALWGWRQADPLIAALISVLILAWSVTLVRDSGRILLESAPRHMDLEEIRAAMKGVEGVGEVHDLHVWTITSRMYALTAHIGLRENLSVAESERIGDRLKRLLDERYEINHATLEFEVCGNGRPLDCEHDRARPAPPPA